MTSSRIRWAAGLALLAAVAAGCSTHHPTGGAAPTTPAPVSHSASTAPKPPATPPKPPATPPTTHHRATPPPAPPAPTSARPTPPGDNGGDHDADNNGGPDDGDGNISPTAPTPPTPTPPIPTPPAACTGRACRTTTETS